MDVFWPSRCSAVLDSDLVSYFLVLDGLHDAERLGNVQCFEWFWRFVGVLLALRLVLKLLLLFLLLFGNFLLLFFKLLLDFLDFFKLLLKFLLFFLGWSSLLLLFLLLLFFLLSFAVGVSCPSPEVSLPWAFAFDVLIELIIENGLGVVLVVSVMMFVMLLLEVVLLMFLYGDLDEGRGLESALYLQEGVIWIVNVLLLTGFT